MSETENKDLGELVDLLNTGQFGRVAELGAQLTQSQPNAAVPWALLAAAQAGLGKLEDAAAHYQTALALNPDFTEARFNLGVLLVQQQNWAEAQACFDRVLRSQPGHAQASIRLANCWHALNQLNEAVAVYEQAVALNPEHAETHANYGSALMGLNRLEDALHHYDAAVQFAPDRLEYQVDRAQALISLGAFDHARSALSQVIVRQPGHPKAHFRLSTIKRYDADDPDLPRLAAALAGAPVSLQDQVFLHFAQAKAFEDCAAYDDAFRHYVSGNQAHKTLLGYRLGDDRATFDQLKSQQRAALLPSVTPTPVSTPRPIFVLGLPRSGTSLVEQILASHSRVTGGGELSYFEDAMMDSAAPEQRRAAYLDRLRKLDPTAEVITDKRPMNFKWIGFILQVLPEARIVNVRRNPAAAGWSMFKHHFESPAVGFTNDLHDIAAMVKLYDDLMAHFEAEFPGRIYSVNYERLTETQEQETRRLLAACDLAWEDTCLDFHKTERAVQTASAAQVRKKMYQDSSGAWKPYAPHLKDFLNALAAE